MAACLWVTGIAQQRGQASRLAQLARRRGPGIAAQRIGKLGADIEQLLLGRLALQQRAHLQSSRPHQAQDRHQDDQAQISKTVLAASDVAHQPYQSANGVPLRSLPGAPLFTSYTWPGVSSGGATMTQLASLSVIGSMGMARRYFLLTNCSSESG